MTAMIGNGLDCWAADCPRRIGKSKTPAGCRRYECHRAAKGDCAQVHRRGRRLRRFALGTGLLGGREWWSGRPVSAEWRQPEEL